MVISPGKAIGPKCSMSPPCSSNNRQEVILAILWLASRIIESEVEKYTEKLLDS